MCILRIYYILIISYLWAVVNHLLNVGPGHTIDQVKNGASAPFLQIRDGLGVNRGLKGRPKKKKKGETRQCQTGMENMQV